MKSNLLKRGFLSLIVAQFFGAANDNILKQVLTFMVATGLWAGALGPGGQAYVAWCLTLPFILLSGYAGQIADRHSKRSVIVAVKIAEVPIAALAMIGLWTGSLWLTMTSLVLLAAQSTFFGPAKYGIIPELVASGDLSRANGSLNMFTNIGIIVGSLAGGPISDAYFPKDSAAGPAPPAMLWLPGAVLLAFAVAGLIACLPLPRVSARNPSLDFAWNPSASYSTALRDMARGPVIVVAAAWAFFYLIGMIALLALPEYESLLGVTYTKVAYLLGVLGVAIGLGSVVAGLISGHMIRPMLIPIGAVGMSVFFLLLGALKPAYWSVMALLLGAGACAGLYIVPLQALLQKLSPDDERGRFLGTANAMSFLFSSVGAGLYWLLVNRLGLPANRVFLVCFMLIVPVTGYLIWRLRPVLRRSGLP